MSDVNVLVAGKQGPLYLSAKWNHVKIYGFSRVTNNSKIVFTFTQKSWRSLFRAFHKLPGNFLATFHISSNFFPFEQLFSHEQLVAF